MFHLVQLQTYNVVGVLGISAGVCVTGFSVGAVGVDMDVGEAGVSKAGLGLGVGGVCEGGVDMVDIRAKCRISLPNKGQMYNAEQFPTEKALPT